MCVCVFLVRHSRCTQQTPLFLFLGVGCLSLQATVVPMFQAVPNTEAQPSPVVQNPFPQSFNSKRIDMSASIANNLLIPVHRVGFDSDQPPVAVLLPSVDAEPVLQSTDLELYWPLASVWDDVTTLPAQFASHLLGYEVRVCPPRQQPTLCVIC